MGYEVVLSDLFLSDLKIIVENLKVRAGAEIASRIGNELLDRALAIGRNPYLGRPVQQREGVRKVLRHSYLIYYNVDETRHRIEVLRVWHGARDTRGMQLPPS